MPLDPGAQAVLDLIKAIGRPGYETLTPPEAREVSRASRAVFQPEAPDVSEVRDLMAPGPGGPIPLRFYRAAGAAAATPLPLLVFYHGGGWTIGDLDIYDVACRHLANTAGCAVLSVDYRLGPEHKFPAAVEDCFAALQWAAGQAEALTIDASRIAVGGDSAGGNLSAVISILARDHGAPKLSLQMLVYPATDFVGPYESQKTFAEGYLLTAANQAWFRGHYLRTDADAADWRASPFRAPSLKGVAPAWVLTAGYDPLFDEGEAYASRLKSEGVAVATRRFDGQIHGFITMGKMIPEAKTALDEAGAALKAAFSGR